MQICPQKQKEIPQLITELKKLRKKIFKITKNRDRKIRQIYRQSVHKNIQVSLEINKVVSGQRKLGQNEPKNRPSLVDNPAIIEQKWQNKSSQISNKKQGIDNYWKNILLGSYGDCIKKQQLTLLDSLKLISFKQYNNNKCSLSFSFTSGHHLIHEGDYIKTILRDQQGQPISYGGDQVANCRKLKKGFFKTVLQSTRQIQKLKIINSFFQILTQQIIPRSLYYYLQVRVKQNPDIFSQLPDQQQSNQQIHKNQ